MMLKRKLTAKGKGQRESRFPHKQRNQRHIAHLTAPMPVNSAVEGRSGGKHIGAVKVFPRMKTARTSILQADFHDARQNKTPLWCSGAMEFTAKADRTGAQLVAARWKNCR